MAEGECEWGEGQLLASLTGACLLEGLIIDIIAGQACFPRVIKR